jgi:hypothetical protein
MVHAPSMFDFRERDDLLFAYLSDSDSVNVTSIYEMYPIGWFSLKQHLADRGLDVKIVNVAALMLRHPALDVKRLLGRLAAPVFGFDLHWMTQCHGAIELAAQLKEDHARAPPLRRPLVRRPHHPAGNDQRPPRHLRLLARGHGRRSRADVTFAPTPGPGRRSP